MFASWPSARALQPHPCVEDLPRYRLHRQLPRHFTASFAFARALRALLLSFFLGLGVWLVEVHRGTVMLQLEVRSFKARKFVIMQVCGSFAHVSRQGCARSTVVQLLKL